MDWKQLLTYITGSVDQQLLLRNEYLVTENRILRQQITGRLRLRDGERQALVSHLKTDCPDCLAFLETVDADGVELALAGPLPGLPVREAALQQVRHELRQKRGSGAVRGESVFHEGSGESDEAAGLEQFIGSEPTPEFAAQVAEEYQRLLSRLGDDDLRKIAVWKMEGYSNKEIADKLGCVPRTVERKLGIIRTLWSQE